MTCQVDNCIKALLQRESHFTVKDLIIAPRLAIVREFQELYVRLIERAL